MHTHAVARISSSYEHIDPATVGNERRFLVSELSGQSTILTKTNKYAIAQDKALMQKILAQVQQDLAQFIGPMARVLVKRALREAPTVTKLYEVLALEIADERDRKKFLALRRG